MAYAYLFVFGAVVGSFLNVVALRWKSGITLGGRSFCPRCGKMLKWYELVPVLSFLALRGRCGKCRSKISWQYLMIEIITGLVFLSIYHVFGLTPYSLLLASVFSIYIIIVIYDLRHKIIPDELVYSAIVLSALFLLTNLQTYKLLDLAAGPIIFSFFALIWLVSKGRAMGFGDAKLGLSIGILLGAGAGFSAIVMAFWVGSITGLFIVLFKKFTMKSEVPFAPFMVLGAWISLILNLDILHVALLF